MEKKRSVSLRLFGLFLIVFVLWPYIMLYPYALMTRPASEVNAFCKFSLTMGTKLGFLAPGSIFTGGLGGWAGRSKTSAQLLRITKYLMSLMILISGIGLLLRKKVMLKIILSTVIAFVALNGLSLISYFVGCLLIREPAMFVTLIKQLIFTGIFSLLLYYLHQPKIKEQFS